MGFIDWHGNKTDHYDDVVEFAKMKEIIEAENFGTLEKKKTDAEFFQCPELASLNTSDVLKLLLKEKKGLDILHQKLTMQLQQDEFEIGVQLYKDAWLYLLTYFFDDERIPYEKQIEIIETFANQILKLDNSTSVKTHSEMLNSDYKYQKYILNSFSLNKEKEPVFWQWIGYIDSLLEEKNVGQQFAKIFELFIRHFAFYLNQILPDYNLGREFAQEKVQNTAVITNAMRNYRKIFDEKTINNFALLCEKIVNPLYRSNIILPEKTWKEKMADYLIELRYAKAIVWNYTYLGNEEEAMLTAGCLYMNFKEKRINQDRIIRIFPENAAEELIKGKLFNISPDEVKYAILEDEVLHYYENAITYIQDKEDPEVFRVSAGCMGISNNRVTFIKAGKTKELSLDMIAKVVLYESEPEVLEITTSEETILIRTANTAETYQIFKLLLKLEKEPDRAYINMDKLSLDAFVKDDMDAYIYHLKTLCDPEMPLEMQDDIANMIDSLEKLDMALKQYPSQEEPSHRFFTYYIPETIRLIYSFYEYERAGVSEQKMNPVYSKVMEAIYNVSSAARQRVDEIYKLATMGTIAKADALHKIIKQDGYSNFK